MASFPWQPAMFVAGITVAAIASYYSSQISLAEELGDRPTRSEMNGHVQELKEIIVREVKEIKDSQAKQGQQYQDQQKEVRQDIRRLTDIIIEKLR